MKILKMRATFGKLQSAELALGEGLNVIEAPNEGGKSTLIRFNSFSPRLSASKADSVW